jgi:pilus assembly protein CpaB
MVRPKVFVLIAGLVATVAAWLVFAAMKAREVELRRVPGELARIAVATHNVPAGARLDAGSITMAAWPREHVPAGAITDARAAVGRIVRAPVAANAPILSSALYENEMVAGLLPVMIPPGMRAMAVPVDEVSGVAGFVMPHTRVDVLVALRVQAGMESAKAKIVLENIEVLAIAQQLDNASRQPQVVRVVTLLVTPEEAERLALASREGTLRLAIRRYDDDRLVATSGTNLEGLLRSYSAAESTRSRRSHSVRRASQAIAPVRVEVMHGMGHREIVSFINGAVARGAETNQNPAPPAPRRVTQTQGTVIPSASSFANPMIFGPGSKTIELAVPAHTP